jgi:hypothetical protein
MDSSSYTINAGQSVTFTVRLIGNGTAPTGTVGFTAGGNAIAGCTAVAISNSQALCSTSALAAGSYAIKGNYSGDSTYGAGVAGPITQTVNAAPGPMKLSIDSNRYTSSVGQNVTFSVKVTGGNAPTGTFRFTDGTNAIPGCGAVALSGGTATCKTSTLARGSHAIRGWYSGDSKNGAGVAGPITQTVN